MPRYGRESNPEPFDAESRVQSNIPRHLHSYVNSLFAKYKIPVCHIILGCTGIGETIRSIMVNSLYLFTCKSYGIFQKAKFITHADSANQTQW